jgi:DNA primase catalytic subunit
MEKEEKEMSAPEQKIRQITQLYYSRRDIQKAIFEFSENREISPRYFEGFGKRPDAFQFKGDIFGLVKNGATSFHCSEELWENPLEIQTGMSEKEANKIRIGWDLLIDIDCDQGINFSKYAAKSIVETFKQHGICNIGIKFSGSKGFHIIVPWAAFPKEANGIEIKDLFPEIPRKVVAYIRDYSAKIMKSILPKNFQDDLKKELKTGFMCQKCGEFADEHRFVEFRCRKCEIIETRRLKMGTKGILPPCYKCKGPMEFKPLQQFQVCENCEFDSIKNPDKFSIRQVDDLYTLMGLDIVLVSPRHLFRMPYSLHEKTALASVVLTEEELENFTMKDADPLRVKVKNFMPNSQKDEAKKLVMQALDWAKEAGIGEERTGIAGGKYADFKQIKLKKINENQFPPCVKKILEGMIDGKKRGLFILINLFRSIGMEKEELEKKVYSWNEKNEVPLKKGYITSQLNWMYRRKPIMPQNCKKFYQDLGICSPDFVCSKIKNPVNYVVRKNFIENKKNSRKENTSKN